MLCALSELACACESASGLLERFRGRIGRLCFWAFIGVFMLIKRDHGAVRLYVNARGEWVAQWIIDGEPVPVVALFNTESGALAYALSSDPPILE